MKPQGQDFSFVLSGTIFAPDNIGAQARFRRFYRELEFFEDMVQITFSFNKANAEETGESTAPGDLKRPAKTRGENRNRAALSFTINGGIELE
jgi:hypothetical protein